MRQTEFNTGSQGGLNKGNSIVYIHPEKPSFMSKAFKVVMNVAGVKTALEKGLAKGKIKNDAAPYPKSFPKKYQVEEEVIDARKVWTISPQQKRSDKVIFFFHGGGYVFNVYTQHWDLIDKLIEKTGATFVVHDYPLVPQHTHQDAYSHTTKVYDHILKKYSSRDVIFLGDSAGGGLALGFAQLLAKKGTRLPEQIIVSAPWLDASLTNPEISAIDKDDKMLGVTGLQMAGKAYAGDLPVTDHRISPIQGDFKSLPRVSLFIGTHDIFWADAKKLKARLAAEKVPFNYYEYPNMFHNWCIAVGMPESKSVINQMSGLIHGQY